MTDDMPALSAGELLRATGGAPLRGGTNWTCRGISTDTRTLRAGNLSSPFGGKTSTATTVSPQPPKRAPRGSSSGRLTFERRRASEGSAGHRRPGHPGGAGRNRPQLASALPDTARRRHRVFGKDNDERTPRGHRLPIANGPEVNGKLQQPDRPSPDPSGDQGGARARHRRAGDEPPRRDRTACRHRRTRRRADHEHRPRPYRRARLDRGNPRGERGSLPGHAGRGAAVINHDDDAVAVLAERWQGKRVTFGLKPGADLTARRIGRATPEGVGFEIVIDGVATPVRLSIPGRHNVMNALAAAAAAKALGFDCHTITEGSPLSAPFRGGRRSGVWETARSSSWIPTMPIRLGTGGAQDPRRAAGHGKTPSPSWVTCWSSANGPGSCTGRSGPSSPKPGSTRYFSGIPLPFHRRGGAKERFPGGKDHLFDAPERVVADLRNRLRSGDWILVKGSRKMKMEAVAEAIIAAFDLKTQTV